MSQRVMFTSNGVREAVGLPRDGGGNSYTSVSADTRTLRPGALFVALKGERHDAVDLLPEAEAKGAIGAVVPEDRSLPVTELELF
ncbi:MAG: Mur ligase domain-containing protein, partial [Gemmatimonadales bacterium]